MEEFLDIVIGFGRCLQEGAAPEFRLFHAFLDADLSVPVIALIPNEHDGDAVHVPLDFTYDIIDRFEFFKRLAAGDGVDENKRVTLADGQTLHGGELMGASCVGDLESADVLVAADDLPVGILDGRYVAFSESPTNES